MVKYNENGGELLSKYMHMYLVHAVKSDNQSGRDAWRLYTMNKFTLCPYLNVAVYNTAVQPPSISSRPVRTRLCCSNTEGID